MSPWVRVLGVFVVAVAAALLLKVLPPLVVLLFFVGGVSFLNLSLRSRMRNPAPAGGELLGLRRETSDPFGLLGYPLALFDRLSDASVDELVWGTWRGLEVRVFGVSFRAPSLGADVTRTSFGCAMARVDAELPHLVVEPQVFLTSLERPPDLPRRVADDAAVDDRLHVWAAEEATARRVMTPEMRERLLALEPRWGFEVAGRIALVYGPNPDRPDLVGVLESLRGLVEAIPAELLSTRPPAP